MTDFPSSSLVNWMISCAHFDSAWVPQTMFPEVIDHSARRQGTTSGHKIKMQCAALVDALMDCNPHYVRCIKSNDDKQPGGFDVKRVTHQVQGPPGHITPDTPEYPQYPWVYFPDTPGYPQYPWTLIPLQNWALPSHRSPRPNSTESQ